MNLVTGGAGFIGSHLVRALTEAGEAVRVLEHPDAEVSHLPLDRIELVRADIRDRPAVERAVRDCRRVYHLAADPNLWRRRPGEFDAVNHRGALNVIHAALDHGAERVLHTTTESIITSATFEGGPVEHRRFREADMIGPYCRSKYRAEAEVWRLADAGRPVLLFCPTLPVGPGDRRQTPPTRLTLAFCRGRLPAYLDCRLNMVDARDAAAGMIAAMRRGRPGIRYVVGGHNLRLSDWLRMLAAETGRPVPRFRVPYAVALATGWLSEQQARYLTGRMPLATVTGVRLSRRIMHFDARASLEELGVRPRPLGQTLRDALEWYRSLGWLDEPHGGGRPARRRRAARGVSDAGREGTGNPR